MHRAVAHAASLRRTLRFIGSLPIPDRLIVPLCLGFTIGIPSWVQLFFLSH